MNRPILIMGASVRAAVSSAIRGGFQPAAADLFADDDLRDICPDVRKVEDYADGFATIAPTFAASPWMYTGGLENHPDIVDYVTTQRPLLGNTGEILRRVRDPWQVLSALTSGGLTCPRLIECPAEEPETVWLRKPRGSSGGQGVRRVNSIQSGIPQTRDTRGVVFQEFIIGESISAVFVAANGKAVLLGVTEQLVGVEWAGASGFQYVGSIGPLFPTGAARRTLDRIGSCLAGHFLLQGLFGVDAIWSGNQIWPVEVNPRYTSSVEVLERGTGLPAIEWHAAACESGVLPDGAAWQNPTTSNIHGKVIVFAKHELSVGSEFHEFVVQQNKRSDWPAIADVPRCGTVIGKEHPIATVFASGRTRGEVRWSLERACETVYRALGD